MSVKLDDIKYVYFLGIGGIGMSALARWFVQNGMQVFGYDRVNTPLTRQLESEGMSIHYQDKVLLIDKQIIENQDQSLIIYTPAIPKDHNQLLFFQECEFNVKKRAEVLGMITEGMFTIAIAGTHGKTTTTSMVAHILTQSNTDCSAFMGGIATNYETNLLVNKGDKADAVAVVEADEYDRSFLHLHPNISVITSIDADHLDIYGDHDQMKNTFKDFANLMDEKGKLFAHDSVLDQLNNPELKAKTVSYGIDRGENRAENLRVENATFVFDALIAKKQLKDVTLQVPGYHNVENAVAAMSVADSMGIAENKIKEAIASYKGVKRRFEYLIKSPELVYIDDYAHHPTEIESLLKSVKSLYPGKKITAVFQPHLFTRTRDFAPGFSESLSMADKVILLNIYPARELPIPNVDSYVLLDKITAEKKAVVSDADLLETIMEEPVEVLLTIGAGDIDRFVAPIQQLLKNKYHVD